MPDKRASPERLLTIPDLAARWQVSTRTVRRMIARDELPATRIAGQWRVMPADVAALEQRNRRVGGL